MHLLLIVSLLSLVTLPGCWNPFSKSDTTQDCGCTSSPEVCQDVCAAECQEACTTACTDAAQDPMLAGAGVTDEADYSAASYSDKQ